MKVKCIDCEYLRVKEREYYDSDNVRRTEIKYICALTGNERDVMCYRECPSFKKIARCNYGRSN